MPILPNSPGNKPGKKPQGARKGMFNMYWMYALIALALLGVYFFQDDSVLEEVNFTPNFENAAKEGYIQSIVVYMDNGIAEGYLTKEGAKKLGLETDRSFQGAVRIKANIPSSEKISDKVDEWNADLEKEGKQPIQVKYEKGSDFVKLLGYLLPVLLLIVFMVWMSRRMTNAAGGGSSGGIFSVGKSKARIFDKNNSTNVTFRDVAGLAEAKVEIEEIVEFLKNPHHYTDLGAKIPKGALLVGPPGTGKTLLAKAVAGEANVPFLSMSGSDFVEMFVGVGAARVRDLFKQAKEKAPCIIFIDEIDAVGRARGKNPNMGSNDERENTLNQMLTEMDGFATNNGVIILAATNRADMLDKALLRPGRFDRQIYVDLPELSDRVEIFQVHLRNIKVNADLDIEQLARQTQGFSGADIANVCNEAALYAARHKKRSVEWEDFMAAIDRIVGGLEKRSRVITPEEKVSIATHEAGHATVSWLIEYGDPLVKVTIVPRGQALGAAWYAPEERQIVPTQALKDKLCSLLAGRAAEEIFLGQIGTGASNDLERATKIAQAMVAVYGMSEKLPNLNYNDSTGQTYGFVKPYSEKTAQTIDEAIKEIIAEQYERAKSILREHAAEHNRMRDELVEKEVIYTSDVVEILGERKWKSRTDEIIEISKMEKEKEQKTLPENSKDKKEPEKRPEQQPVKADSEPEDEPAAEPAENDELAGNAVQDDDDPGTPPPFTKED